MKTCPWCNIEKPLEQFLRRSTTKAGRGNICKDCHARVYPTRQERRKLRQEARVYTVESVRKYHLAQRYGLTESTLNGLYDKANNVCQVCSSSKDLCIDHNHKTGTVRGILCKCCNTALGMLNEDVVRIRKLIQYIEESPTEVNLLVLMNQL